MAHPGAQLDREGAAAIERPSILTVGTVVWLSSEVMFFAALIAAALTLRAEAGGRWPDSDAEVNVGLGAALTVFLMLSSWTAHKATTAADDGDRDRLQRWLVTTLALGVVFVAGQAYEWSSLDFSISSHAYGSAFYTLTGFHGLHLIGGLIALTVVLGRTSFGVVSSRRSLDVVGAYWHFVDAVWIAVFGVLYLLP